MGIQALVVFIGLAVALVIGILAGTVEMAALHAGWLAIGLLPVIWTLLYLIERVMGKDVWNYAAPYPYQPKEIEKSSERSVSN